MMRRDEIFREVQKARGPGKVLVLKTSKKKVDGCCSSLRILALNVTISFCQPNVGRIAVNSLTRESSKFLAKNPIRVFFAHPPVDMTEIARKLDGNIISVEVIDA